MMQVVELRIWCPASQDVFTKATLRRKAVKIVEAKRPDIKEYSCYLHGALGDMIEGADNESVTE
jgi:hypothetical protein